MTGDLFDALQHVWNVLCTNYDVTAELPPASQLFEHVDPSVPDEAAEIVLVTMLTEIMENVGRFSPWYRHPAVDFGIGMYHNPQTGITEWFLTAEALITYSALLIRLSAAINHNTSVILATRFLDSLDRQPDPDAPRRLAMCKCSPPRTILVCDAVIAEAEIVCDACRQPFALAH